MEVLILPPSSKYYYAWHPRATLRRNIPCYCTFLRGRCSQSDWHSNTCQGTWIHVGCCSGKTQSCQSHSWPRRVRTGVPAGDARCRFCRHDSWQNSHTVVSPHVQVLWAVHCEEWRNVIWSCELKGQDKVIHGQSITQRTTCTNAVFQSVLAWYPPGWHGVLWVCLGSQQSGAFGIGRFRVREVFGIIGKFVMGSARRKMWQPPPHQLRELFDLPKGAQSVKLEFQSQIGWTLFESLRSFSNSKSAADNLHFRMRFERIRRCQITDFLP